MKKEMKKETVILVTHNMKAVPAIPGYQVAEGILISSMFSI